MTIRSILSKVVPQRLKKIWRFKHSSVYSIIANPKEVFRKVYHIKDASWEHVHIPEAYQLIKEWENYSYSPAQDILEIENAIVRTKDDVIIIGDKCVWDKFYFSIFSHMIPFDNSLLEYNKSEVRVRTPKEIVEVGGVCVSLFGVHSAVWAHFIIQFLPKLYYAIEAGILDKDVSILMPDYTDDNIRELIEDALRPYPKVKKIQCVADYRVAYKCEKLMYIPTASISTNHSDYILPYDVVVPQKVVDILKKYIVEPRVYIEKAQKDTPKKIYLVRRGTHRGLTNYEEVEAYFTKQGFTLIEPHKMTMQQKADLYSQAEIIAGPASGAWSNVIFCKNAKALLLNTMSRTISPYIYYLFQIGQVKGLQVTGWDESTSSIHSDFSIPVEKIDAAYKQLVNE